MKLIQYLKDLWNYRFSRNHWFRLHEIMRQDFERVLRQRDEAKAFIEKISDPKKSGSIHPLSF